MSPRSILLTLAEDTAASTEGGFAVLHRVDEHDCLHFAAALREHGHEVYFVNWRELDLDTRTLHRAFHCNRGTWVEGLPFSHFDLAFIYKMEGFLREQARFLAMVEAFEQSCAVVVNAPATIRANIDKSYLFELAAAGIPVIRSWRLGADDATLLRDLRTAGQAAVLKPMRGERGQGILRLDPQADEDHWRDVLASVDRSQYLAQRYERSIRAGERSIAFLGHAFQHAVIKFPNPADPAEFRCNESLGGKVEPYAPTTAELDFAGRVLRACESCGWPVHFSRIDLIDSPDGLLLMEAELLNPSVFANYVGRGAAFGEALAGYFESLMCEKARVSQPPRGPAPLPTAPAPAAHQLHASSRGTG